LDCIFAQFLSENATFILSQIVTAPTPQDPWFTMQQARAGKKS